MFERWKKEAKNNRGLIVLTLIIIAIAVAVSVLGLIPGAIIQYNPGQYFGTLGSQSFYSGQQFNFTDTVNFAQFNHQAIVNMCGPSVTNSNYNVQKSLTINTVVSNGLSTIPFYDNIPPNIATCQSLLTGQGTYVSGLHTFFTNQGPISITQTIYGNGNDIIYTYTDSGTVLGPTPCTPNQYVNSCNNGIISTYCPSNPNVYTSRQICGSSPPSCATPTTCSQLCQLNTIQCSTANLNQRQICSVNLANINAWTYYDSAPSISYTCSNGQYVAPPTPNPNPNPNPVTCISPQVLNTTSNTCYTPSTPCPVAALPPICQPGNVAVGTCNGNLTTSSRCVATIGTDACSTTSYSLVQDQSCYVSPGNVTCAFPTRQDNTSSTGCSLDPSIFLYGGLGIVVLVAIGIIALGPKKK